MFRLGSREVCTLLKRFFSNDNVSKHCSSRHVNQLTVCGFTSYSMEGPLNLASLSQEKFKQFINSFDTVLTDCDGVIFKEDEPIPGVAETITKLQYLQKNVRFVTNNTVLPLDRLQKKLNTFGIETSIDEIVYPTLALIKYLKSINFKKKLYLCGMKAVKLDLQNAGFEIADSGPILVDEHSATFKRLLEDDPEIGAVVLEFDLNLNYLKLMRSSIYLRRPDVLFLVGITEKKIPLLGNIIGNGYFYKMVEEFTGRKASVFGKPSTNLSEFVKEKFNINKPERVLFIGDSLYQDMSFASISGFQKLFVLTGLNTLEEAKQAEIIEKPDYYIKSLGDLICLMNNHL